LPSRRFEVRRAFRGNVHLHEDSGVHWQWQLGGWLLVDRVSEHVTAIKRTGFDEV
jgi:hypothetical protein